MEPALEFLGEGRENLVDVKLCQVGRRMMEEPVSEAQRMLGARLSAAGAALVGTRCPE